MQRLDFGSGGAAAGTVAGHAGNADLHADVTEALRHGALRGFDDLRDFAAADAGCTVAQASRHLPPSN